MINQDLIKRIEDKILDTMLLAQEKFGRTFNLPNYNFEINSTRIAGQAFYAKNLIKINPKYLLVHIDEVINVTIPHEIAHLITHLVYPNAKQSHGPEFKSVMVAFGLPPVRCHNMIIDARPHIYKCSCRTFNLSNLIHKRIKSDGPRKCGSCDKFIVYSHSI